MASTHGGGQVCHAPERQWIGLGDVGYCRRGNFGSSVVDSMVSISDGTIVQEVGHRVGVVM